MAYNSITLYSLGKFQEVNMLKNAEILAQAKKYIFTDDMLHEVKEDYQDKFIIDFIQRYIRYEVDAETRYEFKSMLKYCIDLNHSTINFTYENINKQHLDNYSFSKSINDGNSKDISNSTSTGSSTSEQLNKNLDTPQTNLEDIKNGKYLTSANMSNSHENTNSSDSSTSTNTNTNKSEVESYTTNFKEMNFGKTLKNEMFKRFDDLFIMIY